MGRQARERHHRPQTRLAASGSRRRWIAGRREQGPAGERRDERSTRYQRSPP